MSRFEGIPSEHPKALALVMCDRVITDLRTNKRSLIDIFDTVVVPVLPATLMRLSIYVCVFRGTADTSEMYMGLFSPSGDAILQSVLNVTAWGASGQAEFDMSLEGILLTSAGNYDLRLFVADSVLAQRILAVQIVQPPPVESVDSPAL